MRKCRRNHHYLKIMKLKKKKNWIKIYPVDRNIEIFKTEIGRIDSLVNC